MHRNAPVIPPPGRCYCCGKTDVSNWVDDEQNLCGDCVSSHVFCDSCGADVGLWEAWKNLPGIEWGKTAILCGTCLVKGH